MNGCQRVRAALEGRWPDRRPVVLHNFMSATREAGLTAREYAGNPEKIARVHIQAVEKYQLDGVLLDLDTAVLAGAVGVPVDQPEDEPARAFGRAITTLEQVPDLPPPEVGAYSRVQVLLEAARILRAYFGDEIYLRGNCDQAPFSLASMMRSPADWMIDLAEEDARVVDLLEYCTTACLQLIRLMADTGVHMVSNGDSPAGPDLISPVMYRRFALPYEARLAGEAHSLGIPYLIHICGNTQGILPDMLEAGPDGVELDYKTDLSWIHRHCAGSVLFSGNLDPVGVLERGSPRLVREKTVALLDLYRDSPRLIVNAGCAIPPATPEAHLRALVDTAREWSAC